jgi:hypothetical protein
MKRSQKIKLIIAGIGLVFCIVFYTPIYIEILNKLFA